MKPTNEKISLDQFAKKFFGIKPQPYQRDMIKLIESGKTKRLKLVPLRPTSSLKHRDFFAELIEEHTKAYAEACSTGVGVISISCKPDFVILDDVMDVRRYDVPPITVKHIPAIAMVKATL